MAPSRKDTSDRSYDSKGNARQGHLDAGKTPGVDMSEEARKAPRPSVPPKAKPNDELPGKERPR